MSTTVNRLTIGFGILFPTLNGPNHSIIMRTVVDPDRLMHDRFLRGR